MLTASQSSGPAPAKPSSHAGVLQRKCACGAYTSGGGQCDACAGKRAAVQRRAALEGDATAIPGAADFGPTSFSAAVLPDGPGATAGRGLPRSARIQAKMAIASEQDAHERVADRVAEQVVARRAESGPVRALSALESAPASTSVEPEWSRLDSLPAEAGRPLSSATRGFAEPAFGLDFGHVRLHTSPAAQRTAARIGARAFTHGSDIWLGPRESESDRLLMSHELTHVVQQNDGVVHLRAATALERRAWLSFFSLPVPRRLLNNYMDDTGATVNLSLAEMIGCNPIVDIRRSAPFMARVAALRAAGGGAEHVNVRGPGGARTNGTLGNFTINYAGQLTVSVAGNWTFTGVMNFYDYWDFDPKPFASGSGRPAFAEVRVRVAAAGLPGRPFNVTSVTVPVSQTNTAAQATWAGGAPASSGAGTMARAASDIAVGGVGGDVAGGPDVGDVGGDVGAQSAEDLNP